jgi:hypothetical protein
MERVSVAQIQQHPAEILNFPVRADERRPGVAWARGLWPLQWIEVGRDWFALTAVEQQAALLHEVGHCRGHHLIARFLLLPFCWLERVQRLARAQELAADAFAVRQGHGIGLLHLIFRYQRVPVDPIARLLCPSAQERAQHVLQLLQEIRDEKLAA